MIIPNAAPQNLQRRFESVGLRRRATRLIFDLESNDPTDPIPFRLFVTSDKPDYHGAEAGRSWSSVRPDGALDR